MSLFKRISFQIFLIVLSFSLTSIARGEEAKSYIAVLDFETSAGTDKSFTDAFYQRFVVELVASNKYRVVERKSIGKILEEQAFQIKGCTSSECAVEIGRILSAQKVIIGNILRSGNTYYVTAQIINVETALIEETYDVTCECAADLGSFLGAAKILAHKFTGSGITDKQQEIPLSKLDIELQKAKRVRAYGRVMTVGGVILVPVGIVMLLQHDCEQVDDPNNPGPDLLKEECSGPDPSTAIGLIVIGGVSFAGGVPTLIYGSNKVKKLEQRKGRITSYQITPVINQDRYGLLFTAQF